LIPIIPYAAMRRSGSHFAIMRTLGSIKLEGWEYGLHLNSIAVSKLASNEKLCQRKQNYAYTSEQRIPRTHQDKHVEEFNNATQMYLDGKPDETRMELKFIAINVEDISVDESFYHAQQLASRLEGFEVLPVCFVILRALRSVALSRKAYTVRQPKSLMRPLFEELKVDIWDDHCEACETGKTKRGATSIPLHYRHGSETGGQSFLDMFRSHINLPTYRIIPEWLSNYVPVDAKGSSFCGSGHNKEIAVRESLRARKPSLKQFEYLFDESRFAKEHANKHGEA